MRPPASFRLRSTAPAACLLAALLSSASPLALAQMAATAAVPAASSPKAGAVAPIVGVVLYPGSALIERVASLRAGDSKLEILGIPANFDVQTLRVEAESGIDVGEITLRESARSGPLNAEEERLENEVRRLSDRIAALDVDRKAAELELKYLDSLPSAGETSHPANLSPVLASLRQGSSQAQLRILAADGQKVQLERDLQARQSDLERVRPAVSEVRNLQVHVNARRDGKLHIYYQLAEAGWRPAYRAALNAETAQVEMERTAQIAQRSGEDWSRVSLRLSTGQPRQQVSGPEPQTWGVSLRPEYRAEPYAAMPAMAAAPAPMRMAKSAAAKPEPQAEPLFQAAEIQSEYATEYAISAPLSVPSDGRKINVTLSKTQLPVKLQVQVSPRQEKAAYLMARGDLPEGVWPAGEMQLYRNGAYVGTKPWDASQRKGLELPFGRDELVKVASSSVVAKNASSGFVGQRAERHVGDVYTVSNLHKRPVELLVLEASPVSRDEKIEVVATYNPPISQTDWDDRQGVVAWEQSLAAGASQKFSVDYRITWPKERSVIGLP
ncbi:MAG: mucoidy inhibitor MuiA family protein [Proteobacteria bacterium]|nr:mucoidy inhibitor MuiA family protein [Pseudomonadota bacterium]